MKEEIGRFAICFFLGSVFITGALISLPYWIFEEIQRKFPSIFFDQHNQASRQFPH
jgi:hypothetical protein